MDKPRRITFRGFPTLVFAMLGQWLAEHGAE
jgi:hypothetical protein